MKFKLCQVVRIAGIVLFLSINSYAKWQQTNGPWGGRIYSLLVKGDTLYAGTYDGTFRSANNGDSWSRIEDSYSESDAISLFAVKGDTIFAALSTHVIVSGENCNNWYWASVNILEDCAINALAVNDSFIFVGYCAGIFRSDNNGDSWIKVNENFTPMDVEALVMKGDTLFAGIDNGSVCFSIDNGINWNMAGMNDSQVVALGVCGTSLFAGTKHGTVYRTDNNGISWIDVSPGTITDKISAFVEKGDMFFVASNGNGIFRSNDKGETWTTIQNGLDDPYVSALVVKGEYLFVGTERRGIYRSSDNGNSWKEVNHGMYGITIESLATCGDTLYAEHLWGIFRTTDKGTSWTNIYTYATLDQIAVIDSFIITQRCTGRQWDMAVSNNRGHTWEAYDNLPSGSFDALTNNGTMLLGGYWINRMEADSQSSNLFVSYDQAKSWEPLTNSPLGVVFAIAADGTTIIILTDNGIFRSDNDGVQWTKVSDMVFDKTSARHIAFSGKTLFVGLPRVIYSSSNSGKSWESVLDTSNLLFLINSMALDGENLYIANHPSGPIMYHPLNELVGTSQENKPPSCISSSETFVLQRKNCLVSCVFTLSRPEQINAAIYSVSGHRVVSLANSRYPAGIHHLQWNSSTVSPGLYTIKIDSGERSSVRTIPVFR